MKNETIHICIAPARKIATVKQGKKFLKRYSFKTIIPFTIQKKEVSTYDYREWCVSERSGLKVIEVKVYCDKAIKDLRDKVLEYYLSNK